MFPERRKAANKDISNIFYRPPYELTGDLISQIGEIPRPKY